MKVLVTGAAGFIGYHTSSRLLERGHQVVGIDNLSEYYDVRLKLARLERLQPGSGFGFRQVDLVDRETVGELFRQERFDVVVHLAAQAGVRHSLSEPHTYVDSNVAGTLSVLEACRHSEPKHLVYASSSSVYGRDTQAPFSTTARIDRPSSLYAATKVATEAMAFSYAQLFGIPTTGLRFFTVYGPWGRPDMAYFKFAEAIMNGQPIELFNNGDMQRDFTYVDDVVDAITTIVERDPLAAADSTPHRIYNVGHSEPEQLDDLVSLLEKHLGRDADRRLLPMQSGDVYNTFADISATQRDYGFRPTTTLDEGIERFADWYMEFRRGA